MKKKLKSDKQSKLFVIMVLLGVLVIVYPIIGKILNKRNQTEVIFKYTKEVEEMNDEEIKQHEDKYQKYNDLIIKGDNNIDILNVGEILGFIKIAKINLLLPIYQGTEEKILYKGIGHMINSGLPTDEKNYHCVLVGHSGLSNKTFFDKIEKLEIEDEFIINILNKSYKYKVYKIKKVLPNNTNELIFKKGKKLVTLVTCTPKYINSHRLLVMGEMIEKVV